MDTLIVEVVPLPCSHLYRLTKPEEIKPRGVGWGIEITCHCGIKWKLKYHQGALDVEKLYD